jgi:ATP-dependent RNA helicase DHR2
MIEENQVTILLGETGSGKSTRIRFTLPRLTLELPQFLLSKYENKGIIGITQPRRVAAVNLARRVAEEQGTILRNKVAIISSSFTNKGRLLYPFRRCNKHVNPNKISHRRDAPPRITVLSDPFRL